MKLTRVERLILANQLHILEKLDPDSAKEHAIHREALERGYEADYDDVASAIYEETLDADSCRFVVDVLEMHRALHFAYRNLPDKSSINERRTYFRGFDGNSETKLMAYTQFLTEQGRWTELQRDDNDNFNSHAPTVARYRKMLQQYNDSVDTNNLTNDDIQRIIA